MGYSTSGGPKGLGVFNVTAQTAADLNKLLELIARLGNFYGGIPESQRDAITGDALYEGLLVFNTDSGALEMYDGSGWASVFHGWRSWSPSRVNNTSGALSAVYMRVGDLIRCRIVWTLTGGNISGNNPSWSLPVPADVLDTQFAHGTVTLDDANGDEYPGVVRISASTATPYYMQPDGNRNRFASVNATAPFTWVAGDRITMEFDYKAA